MSKFKWILYCLAQSISVFYMTAVAANARIEDMGEAVLSEEDVADYSCAFGEAIVAPKSAEVCYGIDMPFLLKHIFKKLLWGYSVD